MNGGTTGECLASLIFGSLGLAFGVSALLLVDRFVMSILISGVAFVLGIAAIVLGVIGRLRQTRFVWAGRSENRIAILGIALGIVAIILVVVALALGMSVYAPKF
jgi:uncharacterized membrane protein